MTHLSHNKEYSARVVVFLVYPDMGLLHMITPLTAFWLAGRLMGDVGFDGYDLVAATPSGGQVRTAEGVAIDTTAISELNCACIDTLIIPGRATNDRLFSGLDALVAQIPSVSKRARRVAVTCSAAGLLARAGLVPTDLSSLCDASPHASRITGNAVRPGISIHEDNIWISEGSCPGMNLALALIEHDCGRDIALKVSQEIQVFVNCVEAQTKPGDSWHRHAHHWGRFERLRVWLSDNLHRDDLNIEAMAARMTMSPRNLFRTFKDQFEKTPTAAVNILRVDKARQLLGNAEIPMSHVAQICGFGSVRKMRLIFINTIKISPREYRRLFAE